MFTPKGDAAAGPAKFELRPVIISVLVLCFPFFCHYVGTILFFKFIHHKRANRKLPPTVPHAVPILENTIAMWLNARKLIDSATWRSGKQAPFALPLINTTFFFLQGAENVKAMWKTSGSVTGTPSQQFCLQRLFGMHSRALEVYAADNSGPHAQAYPGSTVAPQDRIDHRTHVALAEFLGGKGLRGLYERFMVNLQISLTKEASVLDEWVHKPDLNGFFENTFGAALTEAICGPILQSINPHIMQDLSEYDDQMPSLLKGLPRWMIPEAYRIREKLHHNVLQWHSVARRMFKESAIDADGDFDPFWGSKFMRDRQQTFANMKGFDNDAHAASDLGFIWAANTNIVPSAMWATMQIFRDNSLLSRLRQELEAVTINSDISKARFDLEKLLQLPLLQSLYCETLRLNVDAYIMRYADRADLQIGTWAFPKNSIVLVTTMPAHTDKSVWNTGERGEHPVDKFWADRFLMYADDKSTGPVKKMQQPTSTAEGIAQTANSKQAESSSKQPQFSTAGTAGHWFPYGGGERICPGRHFARRGIMAVCALMTTVFDIEVLTTDRDLKVDPSFGGLGSQRPAKKVPFRIRKRRSEL